MLEAMAYVEMPDRRISALTLANSTARDQIGEAVYGIGHGSAKEVTYHMVQR